MEKTEEGKSVSEQIDAMILECRSVLFDALDKSKATFSSILEYYEQEGVDKSDFKKKMSEIKTILEYTRYHLTRIELSYFQARYNNWLQERYSSKDDAEDLEKKKTVTKYLNNAMRYYSAYIEHPITKEPCVILSVGSPDGFGRYVLEDKDTKKRSMTKKSVFEYYPVKFLLYAILSDGRAIMPNYDQVEFETDESNDTQTQVTPKSKSRKKKPQ